MPPAPNRSASGDASYNTLSGVLDSPVKVNSATVLFTLESTPTPMEVSRFSVLADHEKTAPPHRRRKRLPLSAHFVRARSSVAVLVAIPSVSIRFIATVVVDTIMI